MQLITAAENVIENETIIFNDVVLASIEKALDGDFLVENALSIADIAIFHQVISVCFVLKIHIESEAFPRTAKWFDQIGQIPCVA
jgi:glutathione S-transferase